MPSITPQKSEVVLKRLKKQMDAAWQYRQENYDEHLKELLDHVYPQAKRFVMDNEKHDRASQSKIVNNVGKTSLKTFAAGMQSGTCSPSRPWFALGANQVLKTGSNSGLISFLQELQSVLYKELAASNVYQVIHTLFLDQGSCGTGCALFDDEPDDGDVDKPALNLIHFPFGTFAVDVNHLNQVTCLYHYVDMTLSDILEKFPEDKDWPYPEKVKTAIDDNKHDQTFKVVHIIEQKKSDLILEGKNLLDKPLLSYWFLDSEKETFLRVAGFDSLFLVWMLLAMTATAKAWLLNVLVTSRNYRQLTCRCWKVLTGLFVLLCSSRQPCGIIWHNLTRVAVSSMIRRL